MAIEVFNRHESKYLLTEEQYIKFYEELLTYMELDKHNENDQLYSIANIYYDTKDHSVIRHSLSKPKYKEKLRIRSYGVPKPDDIVFVEMKKKVLGLVNKRRSKMKLSDAYKFIETGVEPPFESYMNKQVIQEIKYYLTQHELQPMIYLAYDRKALFSKENRDLRITFDKNIRSRRSDVLLEIGDDGEPLMEEGIWLMEVKAEKTVPFWLSQLLSKHGLYRLGFSKYGNEYKKNVRNLIRLEEEK